MTKGLGSGPVFRAFIGDVPRDIDRGRLIQCLEITFGPVVDIQFIPSKSCAFVHFATQSGYENAIREGFVYIKGRILCIQKIKKPLECCNCTMGTA
ncbi:hypothetical protein G9A89_007249 [Geosiphon pyriformis]|nr:hypothetical protein G9A89_007249 [Geosiphon pyriformis]